MLEMTIDSIRVSPMNYQRVVVLKEGVSGKFLPIWIGPAEADAIAVKLQDLSVPRPLTHDLLRTVIDVLGGSIRRIEVTDLNNDTFFAKIHIDVGGEIKEIDCRPSDAVALAVRVDVRIFVAEEVLERAGIMMDKEGRAIAPDDAPQPAEPTGEVKEEELKGMSAFTDFIDSLDLEDFGKRQGDR